MLYVPERFGQGFQTLEDDTELAYYTSAFYAPESERGFRYDDPAFKLEWPLPVEVISEKDRSWPDFVPAQPLRGARVIIVDRELERREAEGRPVRVGMVGAGAMGRGIALQLLGPVRGMELAAISNRIAAGGRGRLSAGRGTRTYARLLHDRARSRCVEARAGGHRRSRRAVRERGDRRRPRSHGYGRVRDRGRARGDRAAASTS